MEQIAKLDFSKISKASQIKEVCIGREPLPLEEFIAVARYGAKVRFSKEYIERVVRSRRLVEKILDENRVVYGLTTGFGDNVRNIIPQDEAVQLQYNILRSHAVSVGEVQVAGQLMREWRRVEPGVRFCFSTTSSTGWKMAEREVGEGDVLVYNPLDFPTFVRAALQTVRPRAVVLVESEIWPNFIRRAAKHGVPVFLVNARVSDRSAPRYRAARWLFKDVFHCFAEIFAQSALDRDRLLAAGAPPKRV